MSRQTDWQAAQQAAGRCVLCASASYKTSRYCKDHLVKARERARKKAGCQPWRSGGVGRPPLNAKQ